MPLAGKEIVKTISYSLGGLSILILGYFTIVLFSEPQENLITYRNNNANVFDLSIPAELNFCGEDIPKNDIRIKSILEKEFMQDQYSRSSTQLLFNKARRWFAYIEPVLEKEGVPNEFKYLAMIESHLSNVHSHAGAAGFWQLMANSAIANGLIVNESVDERLHVQKSTHAACKLIKQAYKVLGNWTLSAAAYNRGINGILRAMKDQGSSDYHQLLLNPETGTFVYRILAYKTLLSNPQHFGIPKKAHKPLSPVPYKKIKVDSTISDLRQFARYIKVDYQVLKAHNPWLISDNLENTERKIFEIQIPKRSKADYSLYLADLNPGVFYTETVATVELDSLTTALSTQTLLLEEGTSLETLAQQYSVSVGQLRALNRLDTSVHYVGPQSILVPLQLKDH